MSTRRSWLWLYGPSGAGKTAVGCELFARLVADGYRSAYIELDQLGMCLPALDAEGSDSLKAANLLTALQNLHVAGADRVVVSGDIAGPAMDDALRRSGSSQPLLCRLRATPETLVGRLRSRGAPAALAEAAPVYDLQFTPPPGDFSIDTSELSVADVADEIHHRIGDWPGFGRLTESVPVPSTSPPAPLVPAGGLLVCGPTAVGKSAVAWELFIRSAAAGVTTAFLDLAQVGSLRPERHGDPLQHRLKAWNVGMLWQNFAAVGAQRLIMNGHIEASADIDLYRRALPGSLITVSLLTATPGALLERVLKRGKGLATQLPGDDLRGLPEIQLRQVAHDAAARSHDLEQALFADLRVSTDDRTAQEVADRIWSHIAANS